MVASRAKIKTNTRPSASFFFPLRSVSSLAKHVVVAAAVMSIKSAY